MNRPFFSIIIPTRNRYDTLIYTIETVLNQKFNSFELIISDNSDPNMRDTLPTSISNNNKIKYFFPETVLPLIDHWEFAISKASGEYIIIIGDDDGCVMGALEAIYKCIKVTNEKIISWTRVEYVWPNGKPEYLSNTLVLPYKHPTGYIKSKDYIKKVIKGKGDYRHLPMLYNSAVHFTLIQELKKGTGKIFNATSPDVYTGFALAYISKKYLTVGYPLTINGVSAQSNGAAHLNNNESHIAEHWQLNKVSAVQWPKILPQIYSPYFGTVEAFVQLSEIYPEVKSYISLKEIYKIGIDAMVIKTEKEKIEKMALIREALKNVPELSAWAEKYFEGKKLNKDEEGFISTVKFGFNSNTLVLNAFDFGCKNVLDISKLIKNIYGEFKETNFSNSIVPSIKKRIRKSLGYLIHGV